MHPGDSVLIDRLLDGKTMSEMAQEFGCNTSTISRWLVANDEISQASARAREESAEAWLDRGMSYLHAALHKDSGIDASAARALAQECARRAAIRNPRYRDGQNIGVTGNVGLTVNVVKFGDGDAAE